MKRLVLLAAAIISAVVVLPSALGQGVPDRPPAATATAQRIAAIEKSVIPALVIKGETAPVVTLTERMEQLNVRGVSVAVFDGGTVEWTKAYGYADKERGVPATPETLFEAGSVSKAVAALAALQLVEKGALDLDANVNDKLRSWHLPDNPFTANRKVTLRNILNHTAGTTVWGFPGYARTDKIPSPIDVLEGKGNTEAVRVWKEPGESWRYSGGGYTIMQVLVSDVTGRSFPDLMRDTVLEPLGMRSSTYEQPLPDGWRARAASGYNRDGVKVAGDWHVYPEMAAAGLWTTATDLAKYALAVQGMNLGKGGILSRQMVHTMLTPGMNSDGLGVFITPDGKRFGHMGADAGFQSSLTAFIDSGAGIAILTNSDNGGRLAHELMLTIAREYGWSGFPQTEKTVVQLSQADTARVLGHYKLDVGGTGELDIAARGGRILLKFAAMPDRELLAESPEKLFFRDDGTPVEVTQNGPTALTIAGYMHAVKIQ
jgi:CubicO group peptidase (beta-lactamase class C family)